MLLQAYGARALSLRVLLSRRAGNLLLCHAGAAGSQQQRDVAEAPSPSRASTSRSLAPRQQAASKPPARDPGSRGSAGTSPRPSASAPYKSQAAQPPRQQQQQQQQQTSTSAPSTEDDAPEVHEPSTAGKKSRPSAASEPDPTIIPRNRGIKDGPWKEQDEKIVKAAAHESYLVTQSTKISYTKEYVMLGKSAEQLAEMAVFFQEKSYRGAQLFDALLKGARSLDDISNIPKDFKAKLLAAGVRTGRSILHHSVASPDGTRKFLLQLHDGRIVECVGIPLDPEEDSDQRKRLTVCVSSQVGCPMRCTFCATGKGGFARNLLVHEIVDQVLTVQEEFGERVSNVVFMGMGEPMLNMTQVVGACQVLNLQLGIGARYLTISTVGVPNTIFKLGTSKLKATLAVSIHAPNQELREKIIPSAKAYPLSALMQDIELFYAKTKRRVTFEYTLLAGVNDQDEHAKELAQLLKSYALEAHVNVIPWNPVDDSEFQRPSRNRAYAFTRVLQAEDVPASMRLTRGLEAAAACGQLRNQHQKEPLGSFSVPA